MTGPGLPGTSNEQQYEAAQNRDAPRDGWKGNCSGRFRGHWERTEIESLLPGLVSDALIVKSNET